MLIIWNPCTDPYFNLALEEYLFTDLADDIFMLWQNDRTIVVGKNQNTLAEINADHVRERKIRVVRRMTGGGAVYHDLGNLNYTFIRRGAGERFQDYAYFAAPVLHALERMGVHAELSGRNDILINGRKVSGNAQYTDGKSVLHHGTLLFDSSVSDLSGALKTDPVKIQSRRIRSSAGQVTNIRGHMDPPVSLEGFRDAIFREVFRQFPDAVRYRLTEEDLAGAKTLRKEKYETWEWNYGSSGKYTFRKQTCFSGGILDVCLLVEDGTIVSARIYGDYFGKRDVLELEKKLEGVRHREEEIRQLLCGADPAQYFEGIDAGRLPEAFF